MQRVIPPFAQVLWNQLAAYVVSSLCLYHGNFYDEHIAAEKEAKVGGEMKLLLEKYHVCLDFVQSMMGTLCNVPPLRGQACLHLTASLGYRLPS